MRPRSPRRALGWLCLAGLALLLAACSAPPPPEPPPPELVQPLAFRVLDQNDRPVPGFTLEITPRQGKPKYPGPYQGGPGGTLELAWLPQYVDQLDGTKSEDKVEGFVSRLEYVIKAEGFLPQPGVLEAKAYGRQVQSAALQSLNWGPAMTRRVQTVVLHRLGDLLGPGLAGRPAGDPLAKHCLDFYERNREMVRGLGVEFAWPSFLLKGDTLRVRWRWLGAPWSGLAKAPLAGQVSLAAGLPLALLAGEDLLPAPGVEHLSLEFVSDISPSPSDPYAAPVRAHVALAASAAEFRALAAGQETPDAFLEHHMPQLVEEGPAAAPIFDR